MDNRQLLLDNIIEIKLNDDNVDILSLKLEYSMNKYSAKKNNIWHLLLNDKPLAKKDKYIIKYKNQKKETYYLRLRNNIWQ